MGSIPEQDAVNTYRTAELAQSLLPARLCYFDELPSTNSHAIELRRRQELFAPAVVVAARQTQGRGRGSNSWFSGCGNITATWVLPVEEGYAPHQLPLIVGLALRSACVELSCNPEIGIKWPNDLLWQDRKLAGILCERSDNADFVGIGLNLSAELPAEISRRAVALSTIAGRAFDITAAVSLINQHLRRSLAGRSSQPFAALIQEYRGCDALLGRDICADVPGMPSPLCGTCEGIHRDGALLLRCGQSLHRLIAASITLR